MSEEEYKPVPPVETRFKPGQSGNPAGKPPMPKEIKTLRKMNRNAVIECFNRYLSKDLDTIKKIAKEKRVQSLDLMVVSIIMQGIKTGNPKYLDALLDRAVGKEKIGFDLNVQSFSDLVKASQGKARDE